MSRRRYGVNQAYHGRRKGGGALKVLVALLAILLVAGVLFLLFVPKEYTDNGVRLRFPWSAEEEPKPSDPIDPSALVVAESPSPSPTPEPLHGKRRAGRCPLTLSPMALQRSWSARRERTLW